VPEYHPIKDANAKQGAAAAIAINAFQKQNHVPDQVTKMETKTLSQISCQICVLDLVRGNKFASTQRMLKNNNMAGSDIASAVLEIKSFVAELEMGTSTCNQSTPQAMFICSAA